MTCTGSEQRTGQVSRSTAVGGVKFNASVLLLRVELMKKNARASSRYLQRWRSNMTLVNMPMFDLEDRKIGVREPWEHKREG